MASEFTSPLRRVASLSVMDWQYLAIAVKELLIARILYGTRPVGKILCELQNGQMRSDVSSKGEVNLARLSWAFGAAAARVPWRSDCLPQAMAADRWLRRYGMRPQFFVGVAKDVHGRLEAHAWLRCDNVTVTGGDGRKFTAFIEPISQASAMAEIEKSPSRSRAEGLS